jgi:hypothetical protein
MKIIIALISLTFWSTIHAVEFTDKKADWARGVEDSSFDITSLEVERTGKDTVMLELTLDGQVPDFREKKTHYRFDFDLDLDKNTGHNGADALVYVSLRPIEGKEKKWTTYLKAHSEAGNQADLQVVKYRIEKDKVILEVKSKLFEETDLFGIYVMTFGDDIFYDELPNFENLTVDLNK